MQISSEHLILGCFHFLSAPPPLKQRSWELVLLLKQIAIKPNQIKSLFLHCVMSGKVTSVINGDWFAGHFKRSQETNQTAHQLAWGRWNCGVHQRPLGTDLGFKQMPGPRLKTRRENPPIHRTPVSFTFWYLEWRFVMCALLPSVLHTRQQMLGKILETGAGAWWH